MCIRDRSSRLPGKVMREIAGKPLLEHLIDRINLDTIDWPLIISTSSLNYDDQICDFCAVKGIECFRETHILLDSLHSFDLLLKISKERAISSNPKKHRDILEQPTRSAALKLLGL